MPIPDTIGYRKDALRYPYRWLVPKPPVFASYNHSINAAEEAPFTEIQVGEASHIKLGLQFPPPDRFDLYRRDRYPTLKDDLEHKTRVADEMIHTYLRGDGKDLNVKPKRSYFDMGAMKKDPVTNNFIIENERDYFSTFREGELERPNPWSMEEPKPEQASFVRSMEYDSDRHRIEIDLETCHYSYSDYPMMADTSATFINKIKSNLTIYVKSRANPIQGIPQNEQVAIDTLREMITEAEFRKYMTHGFILVRGLSGRIYQIFRDQDHTKVWESGKCVEEVCVRLKKDLDVPPTDNVIAFRTMVLCSEKDFKKLGNVYRMAS